MRSGDWRYWSGNIAVAEGALDAGCRFFAGYPITPSSDLMEYIARELPRRGGIFVQAEDEIAAVNMVIGASMAGCKAMTATSGPGFSLMQEGIGYAVMTEVPMVVVNVMRLGPATGQATKAGQGDVMQARWGRHGDQCVVVLCPATVAECYSLAITAFNVSEELRVPVILLSDEHIAHMWEVVRGLERPPVVERRWAETPDTPPFGSPDADVTPMHPLGRGFNVMYTGSTHDEWGFRRTQDPEVHERLVARLWRKVHSRLDRLFIYSVEPGEGHLDVGFVAYGSVYRSAAQAARMLAGRGYRAGVLKLNTLWPLRRDVIEGFCRRASVVVVPELNLGQVAGDVRAACPGSNVYGYSKVGGGRPIYPEELCSFAEEVARR